MSARVAIAFGLGLALAAGLGAPAAAEVAPTGAGTVADSRFFTTPEERARLDRLRRTNPAAQPRRVERKPPPPLPRVEVQGVVLRSRGPGTVWANDDNTLDGSRLAGGIRVEPRAGSVAGARVVLPNDESVALRPGESYDPARRATAGIRIHKSP